jgi:hypothetical protein
MISLMVYGKEIFHQLMNLYLHCVRPEQCKFFLLFNKKYLHCSGLTQKSSPVYIRLE